MLLAIGCCLSAPETSAHILSVSESADDRLAAIQYWRRDLELLPALATLPRTGRLQENPTGALNETCPGPLVHTKRGDIGAGWLHYPKTGGSTVEDVLHLPFAGHIPVRKRHGCLRGQCVSTTGNYPLTTVIRHPVERAISVYFFYKSGQHQKGYADRQRHFCHPGTGKAFGRPCKPKQSVFEFAKSLRLGHVKPTPYGLSGPSAWLSPNAQTSTHELEQFLTSRFFLGTTDRLDDYIARLYCVQHLGDPAANPPSPGHDKQTEHEGVFDLLSDEEYAELVRLNAEDVRLYYWAALRSDRCKDLSMPKECRGGREMTTELERILHTELQLNSPLSDPQ